MVLPGPEHHTLRTWTSDFRDKEWVGKLSSKWVSIKWPFIAHQEFWILRREEIRPFWKHFIYGWQFQFATAPKLNSGGRLRLACFLVHGVSWGDQILSLLLTISPHVMSLLLTLEFPPSWVPDSSHLKRKRQQGYWLLARVLSTAYLADKALWRVLDHLWEESHVSFGNQRAFCHWALLLSFPASPTKVTPQMSRSW